MKIVNNKDNIVDQEINHHVKIKNLRIINKEIISNREIIDNFKIMICRKTIKIVKKIEKVRAKIINLRIEKIND